MRSLGERLALLRKLINLRCGPGAAILPPEVTRIHMDFATRMSGGHMGARKFWRDFLPRLKYHNPSVAMVVNRHDQNQNSPLMTIYLRTQAGTATDAAAPSSIQPASSRTNLAKAQPPGPDEKTVTIDMKDKHGSEILEHFLAETRASPVPASREDIAEMQHLDHMKKQASIDRERVRQLRAEKKKEEDMLKRARAAGGMSEEEEA